MEEKNTEKISMLVLGAVAVIAVVGLVMMFVQQNDTTGASIFGHSRESQIYGGAIHKNPLPYYTDRGPEKYIYDFESGEGVDTIRTQSINYAGGQGPRSPYMVPTIQMTGTLCPFSNLDVKTFRMLDGEYSRVRIGDQMVNIKSFNCGQNPETGQYFCCPTSSSLI